MQRVSQIRIALVCAVMGGMLLTAQAVPAPADQAYVTARQLFETAHDQQAVAELQQFLAKYPKDARAADAAFLLGRSFQRQQQYDKAIAAYGNALTLASGAARAALRAEIHLQLGECAWRKGDYAAAQRSYGNCVKLSTDRDQTVRAAYWQGESAYKLGLLDVATAAYTRVTTTDANHVLAPWACYSLAMIHQHQRHPAQAIPLLRKVVEEYAASDVVPEALLALGMAYSDKARTGNAAEQAGPYGEAVAALTELLAHKNATTAMKTQARLALADAYTALKDYDQAAARYADALPALTGKAAVDARLMRAHALYNGGQYAEAASEYGKVAQAKMTPEMTGQALYWQANSRRQQAIAAHDPATHLAAITACKQFLNAAGAAHARAAAIALLIAYSYEDLAALGDATARTKAMDQFKEILAKWPGTREAKQADAGITRVTATMSAKELWSVTSALPAGSASWNAVLRLAREEFAAEKYENALAAAAKVLDGKPSGDLLAQATYLAAASHHRMGRASEAIPLYQRVTADANAGELAIFARRGLVQALLDVNKTADAYTAAKALAGMPLTGAADAAKTQEQAERRMLLGEAARRYGQRGEAKAAYQQLVQDAPDSPLAPQAFLGLGTVAESVKDTPAAIDAYQQFIARYPDHALVPEALFRLGLAYVAAQEYASAIDTLNNVPASYNQADKATYALAWAYRDTKEHEQANAAFARVADQFPKSPLAADSLFNLGEYWLTQQNYSEAMRLLNRALDLAGTSKSAPLIAYKLGVSAYNAGDYPLAVNTFGRVAANTPNSDYAADSLFWKAASLEKQGEKQAASARDAYLQYVTKYAVSPMLLDAALGAGRTGLQAKQYGSARADLLKALELCTKWGAGSNAALATRAKNVAPEAQYYLGQSYYEEQRYDAALKEFAGVAVYQYEPWYSRSLLQMARCSAQSGDTAAARRTLQLLRKNFPDSDAAQQADAVAKQYGVTLGE